MDKHAEDRRWIYRRVMRYLIVVLLFFPAFIVFSHSNAACREKKQVLVLHSYNKGLEWTDNEDEGIMSALQSQLAAVEVHTEFIDSKRVLLQKFSSVFLAYLQEKYRGTLFSVIITTDDDAFNFMLRNRPDLFPGVPLVFCGVNYLNEAVVKGRSGITGVVEAFDIPATLRIALRFAPETKKVVVINDQTTTGIANRKILDRVVPEFSSQVTFEFLDDLSMEELKQRVRSLGSGTIILLMTFNRDRLGQDFDYNESLSLLSRAAKVPIYGVWDFYLGKGIVGGMLTSGRIQGITAGKMALRILGGESAGSIKIVRKSPNRFMFDYRQLERFGIPSSELPKSSLVINQPRTFHQLHPQLYYTGLLSFVCLLLIILFLLARIRERRDSLKKLERAHGETVTILESIADGFVAFDEEFCFTYVNNEAERIMGHNRTEVVGRKYWETFPHAAGSKVVQFFRQVMETREAGELEYLFTTGTGSKGKQWIAMKAYPAEDGGISVYFRDISEKKEAEEDLIRLATAIEQSAEAVFITDTDWKIRYVNPAFEQMSGYRKSEIIGQNSKILKSDAHDSEFYRKIRMTLNAGKVWSGRITSRKKDGSVYDSEATDSPVRDAEGKIINYVGISRDITVERRLEKELRQAQKMEAIGTLAGGIAHDFNNILSIIIGFTEMAKMKISETNPAVENLQRVLDAGSRAADLVKQILTFSHWEEQEKKPVQMVSFIKETLKLMRPLLPTTIEIRREIEVVPERSVVLMDPTEIHQVLMNLCTNASYAMREKGGTLSVRMTELMADSMLVSRHLDLKYGTYICLSISDTGVGIDASTLERIFDPYFTTKEPGVGTGLGLPVVQGIVKRHHGAVTVYSEPGTGTTFNIFLPRVKGGEQSIIIENEELPSGNERILFLDDENYMAELGVQMLTPFGYKVTAMTDSREALELLKRDVNAFDLVITDMTMPYLTGKELALEIKALHPNFPIILCTGFSEIINEAKAKDSGIDAFLMKPYVVGDLVRTIHSILQG